MALNWLERLFDPLAPADGPPPNRFGAFLRWCFAGAWGAVGWLLVVSLLAGASEAASAWAIGWIVDAAAAAGSAAAFIDGREWAAVGVLAFFVIFRPAVMILFSGLQSRAVQPGLFPLAVWRLHGHTLGQSVKFFEDDFAGRLGQKQTQTARAAAEVVIETIHAVAFGLAAVVGSVAVLWGADGRLALAMVVWLALYGALVRWFLPRIRARAKARAEAQAALSGQIVDSLSHMRTVKLFAHASREEAAARRALERYRDTALEFGRESWRFRAGLAILGAVLPVGLVGLVLLLWSRGQATPGDVAMAGMITFRLSQMSGWISFTAMGIFSNAGVVEDGIRTLTPPHEIVDAPGAADPPPAVGAIEFENVSFRYGRKGGGGLDRFSLSVRPGEKVALVGRSGAGKTTVMSLMLRLYETEGGRVTLDGRDVAGMTQDGLRRQIALVTQETAMFNRSGADNILYGRPDAGRAAAIAAAKEAAAHDFILGLRDLKGREGYDAHLGERGVKLSGGQRQRIAIARAILKDAPILALDEATAALDSETEAQVQRALERLMAGRTVIAIAHRLSTIARMDRIVVMEEGRIAEEGAHDELLARGGLYARFWTRQSGGFIGIGAQAAE